MLASRLASLALRNERRRDERSRDERSRDERRRVDLPSSATNAVASEVAADDDALDRRLRRVDPLDHSKPRRLER